MIILKFLKKYWSKIDNYIIIAFMYFFIISPMQKNINNQLAEIAAQPKYAINNDFEKMRTKKDGSIVLDLNNELNDNHVTVTDSTARKDVKRGLFKRFRKNK